MCDNSDTFVVIENEHNLPLAGEWVLEDERADVQDVVQQDSEKHLFMQNDFATQFYNETQNIIEDVLYADDPDLDDEFNRIYRNNKMDRSFVHSLYYWITYQWGLFVALRYRFFVSRTISFFRENLR